jgi:uncharacterized membrane protein required for colicin V production
MNLADLAILVVLLFGVYSGYKRGFIRLAIAEAGVILMLLLITLNPSALDHVVPHEVPRLLAVSALLILGGFVTGFIARFVAGAAHAVPLVGPADKLGGLVLNALLSFVLLYVAISGLVTLDHALDPIHRFSQVGPAQAAQLKRSLSQAPGAAFFIDRPSLDQLGGQAGASPVPVSNLGTFDAWLGFYENKVRPELVHSSLAPLVLRGGEKLPVVGHHQDFPKDLPRDQKPS